MSRILEKVTRYIYDSWTQCESYINISHRLISPIKLLYFLTTRQDNWGILHHPSDYSLCLLFTTAISCVIKYGNSLPSCQFIIDFFIASFLTSFLYLSYLLFLHRKDSSLWDNCVEAFAIKKISYFSHKKV